MGDDALAPMRFGEPPADLGVADKLVVALVETAAADSFVVKGDGPVVAAELDVAALALYLASGRGATLSGHTFEAEPLASV